MYMYGKRADIKKVFHCCDSEITACRKFIADNPERYTPGAIKRNLTNMLAFGDAYKYRLCDPDILPPFDPEAEARLLGGYGRGQLRHMVS